MRYLLYIIPKFLNEFYTNFKSSDFNFNKDQILKSINRSLMYAHTGIDTIIG